MTDLVVENGVSNLDTWNTRFQIGMSLFTSGVDQWIGQFPNAPAVSQMLGGAITRGTIVVGGALEFGEVLTAYAG